MNKLELHLECGNALTKAVFVSKGGYPAVEHCAK